jgi:hypothetical protein
VPAYHAVSQHKLLPDGVSHLPPTEVSHSAPSIDRVVSETVLSMCNFIHACAHVCALAGRGMCACVRACVSVRLCARTDVCAISKRYWAPALRQRRAKPNCAPAASALPPRRPLRCRANRATCLPQLPSVCPPAVCGCEVESPTGLLNGGHREHRSEYPTDSRRMQRWALVRRTNYQHNHKRPRAACLLATLWRRPRAARLSRSPPCSVSHGGAPPARRAAEATALKDSRWLAVSKPRRPRRPRRGGAVVPTAMT